MSETSRIKRSKAKAEQLRELICEDYPRLRFKDMLYQIGNGEYICMPFRHIFIWDAEDWEKWKRKKSQEIAQEDVA